jgi:excisionase family DNA binding protein
MVATATVAPIVSPLLTIDEAMDYLKHSRSAIYILMDNGALRSVRLGKRRYVERASADALIRANIVTRPARSTGTRGRVRQAGA